jgi:AraC-like DNA-binding protein
VTGTNVSGYINIKRMEYAVSLMKDHPEYTLGAISEACGIKSPATFIRNFKNIYGMTPSEFRNYLDNNQLPPPIY